MKFKLACLIVSLLVVAGCAINPDKPRHLQPTPTPQPTPHVVSVEGSYYPVMGKYVLDPLSERMNAHLELFLKGNPADLAAQTVDDLQIVAVYISTRSNAILAEAQKEPRDQKAIQLAAENVTWVVELANGVYIQLEMSRKGT